MTPIGRGPEYLYDQLTFSEAVPAYLDPHRSLGYMLFSPGSVRRMKVVWMGKLPTELYIRSISELDLPPSTLTNGDVLLGTRYLAYA